MSSHFAYRIYSLMIVFILDKCNQVYTFSTTYSLRIKEAWVKSLISNLFIYPVPKQGYIGVNSRYVIFTTTNAPGNNSCLLIMGRIICRWTHQRTTSIALENNSFNFSPCLNKNELQNNKHYRSMISKHMCNLLTED